MGADPVVRSRPEGPGSSPRAGTMDRVEWLLREEKSERTLHFGERAEIDDACCKATIERLEIRPELRVFLTDAEAHCDVSVEPRDNREDEWLASQVTVAGRADIDFLDGQRAHATVDQAILFRVPGRRAVYAMKAGTRFRSAGYDLEIGSVAGLLDDSVPDALRSLLEPGLSANRVLTMRAARLMRNLALSLFASGLRGPLRHLMMEGAVVQLLALQAAAISHCCDQRSRRKLLSPAEREALQAAHERLLLDIGHPPTLGELARMVGLNEKRLNEGFKVLFGAMVFEVLHNERLEHACIALQSGKVALKEVSFRVGYNHVSNLVSAFTRRCGAPPRQYLERGPSKPPFG